jgi:OOP family OmpA-OmpF porin
MAELRRVRARRVLFAQHDTEEITMNHKRLCALIALSLAGIATAQADNHDDRWYVAPYLGYNNNDDDRLSDDGTVLLGLGLGRYLAPNTAIDVFIDRTQRGANEEGRTLLGSNDAMDSTMYGVALRYFFGDTAWRPYLLAGAGLINHRNGVEDGWDPGLQLGGGLQYALSDSANFRAELGYRYDMDGDSIPRTDNFGDFFLNIGATMAFGEAPEAPPPAPAPERQAPPPAPDCSTLDDDKDGVNNCNDRCPNSAAGEIVGPDGCAQEVVIDLRGVEFRFDCPSPHKAACRGESIDAAGLLPGSIEILDQAVDVLTRYPNVRVEVAGHTDSTGPDGYNQGLSERRARVVYDYLVGKGVDASRLAGPAGYGESRPIDTNDTKEGRQRNRRTELSKQ